MATTVLIPVANGSEDMEVVIVADVLRRAGIDVTLASITDSLQLTLARGIQLTADALLHDVVNNDYDMIALPGGIPGAEALRDCPVLIERLQLQQTQQNWLAAICAAPAVVLHHHDLVGGAYVTCHPHFQEQLYAEYCMAQEAVVIDEHHMLVTSQGPGTAMRFALTLIDVLLGEEKSIEVETPLCMLLEELEDEDFEDDELVCDASLAEPEVDEPSANGCGSESCCSSGTDSNQQANKQNKGCCGN